MLSLGTEFLDGSPVDLEQQIILVYPHGGVLCYAIFLPVHQQQVTYGVIVELTLVFDLNRIPSLANGLMSVTEYGTKFLQEGLALFEDGLCQGRDLLVVNLQGIGFEGVVGREIFQQGIALGQQVVVVDQILQVGRVSLGDHPVQEFTTGLTPLNDEVSVGRRDYDQWQEPYMVPQSIVYLPVALDDLFLPLARTDHDLLILALFLEHAVYHKEILTVPDVLAGDWVEIAFSERQMIDGIQYVGLTHPVIPHQAIDLGIEIQLQGIEVLVVDQGQGS